MQNIRYLAHLLTPCTIVVQKEVNMINGGQLEGKMLVMRFVAFI